MKFTNSLKTLNINEGLPSLQFTEVIISDDFPPKVEFKKVSRNGEKSFKLKKMEHIKIAISVLSGEISPIKGLKELGYLESNPGENYLDKAEKSPIGLLLLDVAGCFSDEAKQLIDANLVKELSNALIPTFIGPSSKPSSKSFSIQTNKEEEPSIQAPKLITEQSFFAVHADKKEKNEDNQLNDEFFYAVGFGNVDKVQALLDKGADPNYQKQDQLGRTPLIHIVCSTFLTSRDQAVIDLLLNVGADPFIKDGQNYTVLQHLGAKKNVDGTILKNIADKFFAARSKNNLYR